MSEQTTIKNEALNYEPKASKNIAELEKISVDLEIREQTFTDKDDKEFTVKLTTVDDEDYRVPDSVLKQLKVHLEDNPDLMYFKVKKKGEGLKTDYTVIPVLE